MAERDERNCHSIGVLTVTFDTAYPEGMWEIIEDTVAKSLSELGLKGAVENGVTGNSVQIQ